MGQKIQRGNGDEERERGEEKREERERRKSWKRWEWQGKEERWRRRRKKTRTKRREEGQRKESQSKRRTKRKKKKNKRTRTRREDEREEKDGKELQTGWRGYPGDVRGAGERNRCATRSSMHSSVTWLESRWADTHLLASRTVALKEPYCCWTLKRRKEGRNERSTRDRAFKSNVVGWLSHNVLSIEIITVRHSDAVAHPCNVLVNCGNCTISRSNSFAITWCSLLSSSDASLCWSKTISR